MTPSPWKPIIVMWYFTTWLARQPILQLRTGSLDVFVDADPIVGKYFQYICSHL